MKKDIRNLLTVLAFSIGSAVALTGSFLYFYSPTGQYEVQNVLLEPKLMASLNYNDMNPKINQMDRYQFDNLVYQFWNRQKQELGELQIDLPTYEKFFNLIKKDDSIEKPGNEIIALFSRNTPSRLIIKVKTESSDKWDQNSKEFQKVEFAENSNYYRIQLHEDKVGSNYAYFYHENIYQDSYHLFIP